LEIEIFLGVLESILHERGHTCGVSAALNSEERILRAVRIISSLPKEIACEVIEQTEIACAEIEQARKAARR
jgi:hypothetical protein